MIKIEKDVPLPAKRAEYPFTKMEVGDSFTIDAQKAPSLQAAASQYKKRNPGWNYTCRSANGKCRIWRTA